MTTIEKSVDVQVPVRTAYNQGTQFESFPHFMEGVDRVTQIPKGNSTAINATATISRACRHPWLRIK